MSKIVIIIVACSAILACSFKKEKTTNCLHILPDGTTGWFYLIEEDNALDALESETYKFDHSKILYIKRKYPTNWTKQTYRYVSRGNSLPFEGGDNDIIYRGASNGESVVKGKKIIYTAFFIGRNKEFTESLKNNSHIFDLEKKVKLVNFKE